MRDAFFMMAGKQSGGTDVRDRLVDDIAQEPKIKPKIPPRYKVLMIDDEKAPFDFAVHMLRKHFTKTVEQANDIANRTDITGSALVDIYPKDVAETKVQAVNAECWATENTKHGGMIRLTFHAEPE